MHNCQVDLLCAGFPCKSVSTLSTTPGSVVDSSCTSGIGWLGVESYVRRHRPPLLLLENVKSLFSERKVEKGVSAQLAIYSDRFCMMGH